MWVIWRPYVICQWILFPGIVNCMCKHGVGVLLCSLPLSPVLCFVFQGGRGCGQGTITAAPHQLSSSEPPVCYVNPAHSSTHCQIIVHPLVPDLLAHPVRLSGTSDSFLPAPCFSLQTRTLQYTWDYFFHRSECKLRHVFGVLLWLRYLVGQSLSVDLLISRVNK